MIIGLEWGICSWKTTIWRALEKELRQFSYITEHTPLINDERAFNLSFSSYEDFLETFDFFFEAELTRTNAISVDKSYILDRTIYSLLGFAYTKWKLDNQNYHDTLLESLMLDNVKYPDILFIITIDNKLRIQRLSQDKQRLSITPSLFYSDAFNDYNNSYLQTISHPNKYYIDGSKPLYDILTEIKEIIWQSKNI